MADEHSRLYQFGPFRLDATRRELRRDGEPVKLYPKQFDVLLTLVSRHGEVVTKDELLRIVWPDAAVEEGNLTTHVSHLRKLLAESVGQHKYIVTIPGRGYQFAGPVLQPDAATAATSQRRKVNRVGWAALALAIVPLAAYLSPHGMGSGASYRQLTFGRGTIWSARFAPDGRTVLYGAAWDGKPSELFLTRPESPESQSLGIPDADVLSISPSGEIAAALSRRVDRLWESQGTLARIPLTGGAPRPLLNHVKDADWAPDGERLAVVRRVGGRDRLEFPIGTVLYESPGFIALPRTSSQVGEPVAFLERVNGEESVNVVSAAGGKRTILSSGKGETGLAWSSAGDELFTTIIEGGSTTIVAVTLTGEQRRVAVMPGEWTLHDISDDGRMLLTRHHTRGQVLAVDGITSSERELSWHDRSVAVDLSPDGDLLLLSEIGAAADGKRVVYLRRMDGSPAIKIGEGQAQALSPDGNWVLANQGSGPERLALLPVSSGQTRHLSNGRVTDYYGARWLPDGRRIAFGGIEPGSELRQYIQDLNGGDPHPAPWQAGVAGAAFAPDGRSFIARGQGGDLFWFDIEGGRQRRVAGTSPGEYPIEVSADGRALFVYHRGEPATIHRVDLATGRRDLWRTIAIRDRAGVMHSGPEFPPVLMTPDGGSYVYNYLRVLSDLFLVEGLR